MDIAYMINQIVALGVAIADALLLALALAYAFQRETLVRILGPYAMHAAFVLACVGVATSLLYSNVLGYLPCSLCWWQRIFSYPQVILLGIALWKKDGGAWVYTLWLSVFGFLVALYQYLLQWGLAPEIGCATTPGVGDCSVRVMLGLGYVTIPMLALTGFGLLILLSLIMRAHHARHIG